MTDPLRVVVQRTFDQSDFDAFAKLSGDDNPIHVDPHFSANSRFGRTVSHGMLLYTVLHQLLEQLAPGAQHAAQELKFCAPAYADEPIVFAAWIESEIDGKMNIAMSATRAEDNVVTCEGRALIAMEAAAGT